MIKITTTIQIDDYTKKKLFKIKLRLEEQKGSGISYNEIIEYLINNQKKTLLEKKNLKEFRRFEGILPKGTLNIYLKEKRKDLENEEKRAQLKTQLN
jgi:hypothetical protein